MTEPRTILITGGSGGIGSALARRCAAVGARPVIGYCSREDLALRVQQQCGCGETLHLDLRQKDFGCDGRLPRVDAVVHNAALFLPANASVKSSARSETRLAAIVASNFLSISKFTLSSNCQRGAGVLFSAKQ